MKINPENFDHDTGEKAQAMMASCRRRMTGMEIDMCEKLAMTIEDEDFPPFVLSRYQLAWFDNMTIQFSREIAEWINQHGRVPA